MSKPIFIIKLPHGISNRELLEKNMELIERKLHDYHVLTFI